MKVLLVFLLTCIFFISSPAFARDVYVEGYYRKDGTYIRPHVRSSPDTYKWNNYGPSKNSHQLMNPTSRNADRDGTPNYLDYDDNNNNIHDDLDPNQY